MLFADVNLVPSGNPNPNQVVQIPPDTKSDLCRYPIVTVTRYAFKSQIFSHESSLNYQHCTFWQQKVLWEVATSRADKLIFK